MSKNQSGTIETVVLVSAELHGVGGEVGTLKLELYALFKASVALASTLQCVSYEADVALNTLPTIVLKFLGLIATFRS